MKYYYPEEYRMFLATEDDCDFVILAERDSHLDKSSMKPKRNAYIILGELSGVNESDIIDVQNKFHRHELTDDDIECFVECDLRNYSLEML